MTTDPFNDLLQSLRTGVDYGRTGVEDWLVSHNVDRAYARKIAETLRPEDIHAYAHNEAGLRVYLSNSVDFYRGLVMGKLNERDAGVAQAEDRNANRPSTPSTPSASAPAAQATLASTTTATGTAPGGLPANASAAQVLDAIVGNEGSGYSQSNGRTGAYGRYQILPGNWAEWAAQSGLGPNAPETPQNQDIVAQHKIAEYVQKYGVQGAMVAWYGGEGAAQRWVANSQDPMFDRPQGAGNEPSIRKYVNDGMARLGQPGTASAGGIGASTTAGPTVTHPTATSSPADIEAYIRTNYPDVAPFLANSEIRKILFDAATAENTPTDSEIAHKVQQTQYWQTHSATSRAFDLLIGDDPSAAGQLVDRAKTTIGSQLQQYGVNASDDQIGSIAKQAIRSGWISFDGKVADQQALNNFSVFALGKQGGGIVAGTQPAVVADQLRAAAKSYYIPMTEQDIQSAALDISTGKSTVDQFKSTMAAHAKTMFQNDPDIVNAITAGSTTDDYFKPIKNTIANTLELDPSQMDLMSPQYAGVLQMYDQKSQARRAMTLGEAQQWARNQPQFKNTAAYKQQDATFGLNLAQMFGAL